MHSIVLSFTKAFNLPRFAFALPPEAANDNPDPPIVVIMRRNAKNVMVTDHKIWYPREHYDQAIMAALQQLPLKIYESARFSSRRDPGGFWILFRGGRSTIILIHHIFLKNGFDSLIQDVWVAQKHALLLD